MKTRAISVLRSAALILVVVGLALWVVSQLTNPVAAADRLPLITVGASESLTQGNTSDPDGTRTTGSLVPSPDAAAVPSAEDPGNQGAQSAPPPSATTSAGYSGGDVTTTTTTRLVVPDPVREHARTHSGADSPVMVPSGGASTGGGLDSSGSGGSSGSGMAGH